MTYHDGRHAFSVSPSLAQLAQRSPDALLHSEVVTWEQKLKAACDEVLGAKYSFSGIQKLAWVDLHTGKPSFNNPPAASSGTGQGAIQVFDPFTGPELKFSDAAFPGHRVATNAHLDVVASIKAKEPVYGFLKPLQELKTELSQAEIKLNFEAMIDPKHGRRTVLLAHLHEVISAGRPASRKNEKLFKIEDWLQADSNWRRDSHSSSDTTLD